MLSVDAHILRLPVLHFAGQDDDYVEVRMLLCLRSGLKNKAHIDPTLDLWKHSFLQVPCCLQLLCPAACICMHVTLLTCLLSFAVADPG
jgi:hypothetical protein